MRGGGSSRRVKQPVIAGLTRERIDSAQELQALTIPCQARNDINISPLLRERIEHSMRSIVSVLGEGSSRRVKLNDLLLAGERICGRTRGNIFV